MLIELAEKGMKFEEKPHFLLLGLGPKPPIL
jgi:hypothetical protein